LPDFSFLSERDAAEILRTAAKVTTASRISARLAPAAPLALFSLMLALAAPAPAFAQARLDAQYEATLAGIPVGRGAWTIDIGEDQYSASAFGGTTGLLKTFTNGSGTSVAQGRVVNGALVATNYSASTTTSKKSEAIHITLQNGNVKDYGIDPQPPVDPERIPLTEAHRRGVYDPMTASLLRVPGNGDPLSPEACRGGAPVFDGRMRYDLKLDFKRMETVKAEKGYHGPAVVCAIYFSPIAGYIPDRPVIKYLATARNIEITFVPLPGTRILVPFRMVIPTPLGVAMLEATQFIAQTHVARTQ
jgi:hypothetical protein